MLVQEQVWQSPDKLKAIRLLGKYPLDALDDTQVTVVFLACHTIDSSGGELFHEIGNGLSSDHWEISKQRLAQLPIERLRPRDHAEASQALFQIVEQAVGRLATKAEAHRQRDERDAASAVNRLAFDDSRKGELLRNYEASCSRTLFRTIDTFVKVRRAGDTGKLTPSALAIESSTESAAPVEQRNHAKRTQFRGHRKHGDRVGSVRRTRNHAKRTQFRGHRKHGDRVDGDRSNKECGKTNPIRWASKTRRSSRLRRSNKECGKTNPIPWASKTRRPSRWRRRSKECTAKRTQFRGHRNHGERVGGDGRTRNVAKRTQFHVHQCHKEAH